MPKAAASTKSEHFHSIFSGTDQVPVSRGDLLPPVTKLPVWGKPSGNCSALAEPCIVTEQWLFSSAGTTRKLLGGIFHLIKNGPDFHNSLAKLLAPEVWQTFFFLNASFLAILQCLSWSQPWHTTLFVLPWSSPPAWAQISSPAPRWRGDLQFIDPTPPKLGTAFL